MNDHFHEAPVFRANDGNGVTFDVAVVCHHCMNPLAFHIEDQVRAREPATHVIAISVAKCSCQQKAIIG